MKTFSKKPLLYALAAFSIGVSFSSFAEIRNVTLLHTNDIESVYEPVDAFWNPDISRIGGIPYLATLIKQTRAQEETSFLFDAGTFSLVHSRKKRKASSLSICTVRWATTR